MARANDIESPPLLQRKGFDAQRPQRTRTKFLLREVPLHETNRRTRAPDRTDPVRFYSRTPLSTCRWRAAGICSFAAFCGSPVPAAPCRDRRARARPRKWPSQRHVASQKKEGARERAMSTTDSYASVAEICRHYRISRMTFYRMLNDPQSGLQELVIRVPPVVGVIRVPRLAFDEWLRRPRRRASRRRP